MKSEAYSRAPELAYGLVAPHHAPTRQLRSGAGGKIIAEAGLGQGSSIIPLVFPAHEKEMLKDRLSSLIAIDRIVSVRLLEVDEEATTIRTDEKS